MKRQKLLNTFICGAVIVTVALISFVTARLTAPKTHLSQEAKVVDKAVEETLWTCSMHPQIQLPEKGLCPLCNMDLIPLKKTDELGPREFHMSDYARKIANVQVRPVEKRAVETTVRMFGKINFDETRLKVVSARFGGRIERLFVDYNGVPVKKGDHLFEIYSPALITAQEELLQAIESASEMRESSIPSVQLSSDLAVEASREKLRLWGLKDEQIKGIEAHGKPLERIVKYSPLTGIVMEKHVREGSYIKEGTPVYSIADLDHLWVELDAYERDISLLHFGQNVSFETESYPGEIFEARINFIAPVLNDKTRTVKLRMNVENKGKLLKPNMFVRASVKVKLGEFGERINNSLAGKWICPMHPEVMRAEKSACDICGMDLVELEDLGLAPAKDFSNPLVVPTSAVLITGKRAVVYVKDAEKDGIFTGREIELGQRVGDFYLVKSGLEEGELVVVNGSFKIDSALQIMAKPSMMSPTKLKAKDSAKIIATDNFRKSLEGIFQSYFLMGKDLSQDKMTSLKLASTEMLTALNAVAIRDLNLVSQTAWLAKARVIELKAKHLSHSANIKEARVRFGALSAVLIATAKQFGTSLEMRVAYCSMAFDNEGASWLQLEEDIENPYFGDAMYRCGSVEETLRSFNK